MQKNNGGEGGLHNVCATKSLSVKGIRKVHAPNITLFGARTERTLEHFSIRQDLASREMNAPYATLENTAHVYRADRRLGRSVIRAYYFDKFGGDAVDDIMRRHPRITSGGVLQRNPFFALQLSSCESSANGESGRNAWTWIGS
jgi:hypothetical protein